MSGLSSFLAQNAVKVENMKITASKRFIDENGAPVAWEVRCIGAEKGLYKTGADAW